MSDRSVSLVMPVGHYLGGVGRARPNGNQEHHVRIGDRFRRLGGGEQLAVWLLSHGMPGHGFERPWTYDVMASAVHGVNKTRLRSITEDLEESGLLVRVDPDGPSAIAFAHRYRLRPLLVGFGWRREGGGFVLGLNEPVALLTEFAYQIWKWGPATPTLWTIAEAFARADRARGEVGDAGQVLADVLRSTHLILANRAGYLDEA